MGRGEEISGLGVGDTGVKFYPDSHLLIIGPGYKAFLTKKLSNGKMGNLPI